jgi:hypothetical protein
LGAAVKDGTFTVDEDWKLRLWADDEPLVTRELYCAGVMAPVSSGKLLYLFSAPPSRDVEQVAALRLPPSCREMLLFSPVVPLLKTARGFQAVTGDEWTELTARDMPLSVENTCNASTLGSRPAEDGDDESGSSRSISDCALAAGTGDGWMDEALGCADDGSGAADAELSS